MKRKKVALLIIGCIGIFAITGITIDKIACLRSAQNKEFRSALIQRDVTKIKKLLELHSRIANITFNELQSQVDSSYLRDLLYLPGDGYVKHNPLTYILGSELDFLDDKLFSLKLKQVRQYSTIDPNIKPELPKLIPFRKKGVHQIIKYEKSSENQVTQKPQASAPDEKRDQIAFGADKHFLNSYVMNSKTREIAKMLILANSDLNYRTSRLEDTENSRYGFTPFEAILYLGDQGLVWLCIEHGARVTEKSWKIIHSREYDWNVDELLKEYSKQK